MPILAVLYNPNSALERLNLEDHNISTNNQAMISLAYALVSNISLKELELDLSNYKGSVTSEGMRL
jgi:hypothetical protein